MHTGRCDHLGHSLGPYLGWQNIDSSMTDVVPKNGNFSMRALNYVVGNEVGLS